MSTKTDKPEPKKYELTPEHEAQLKPWADRWTKNALSTEPMTDDEKIDSAKWARNLYVSANLPEPKNVVMVRSPFVLAIAGGISAAMWWIVNNPTDEMAIKLKGILASKTGGQSTDPRIVEIIDAVKTATKGCGLECNFVTEGTKMKDTAKLWHDYPISVKSLIEQLGLGEFGAACCAKSQNMWNGGNQWSAAASCLSFFRHIAKLDLDYSKWDAYEKLAEHSGPRIMHADFCLVSDRPEVLLIDDRNRPHNDKGPFCKWRDGSALYSIHGTRVPKWVVEHPESITAEKVDKEENVEVRRVMVDLYPGGKEQYLKDGGAEKVSEDEVGILWKKDLKDDEPIVMVEVLNSTPEPDGSQKTYFIRVPATVKSAKEAVAWSFGIENPEEYAPLIET